MGEVLRKHVDRIVRRIGERSDGAGPAKLAARSGPGPVAANRDPQCDTVGRAFGNAWGKFRRFDRRHVDIERRIILSRFGPRRVDKVQFCVVERRGVVVDVVQPSGIFTDRDLVSRVLAKGRSAHDTRVREVMSSPVVKAKEDTAINVALSLMRSHAIRRVAIVNADDELVGVLSLDDVLILLAEEFEAIGALVEKETPAGAI
jgi:CBS domain-containing protein